MRRILLTLGALAVGVSTASAQMPKKQTPPPPLPLGPVAFPAFAEKTLANGAHVLVVENHEQPVVSINIYIKGAGQTAEPEAKLGVANMTATLIDAGTTTKTSKQIAEAIEGLGANVFEGISMDWANMTGTMLKSDVDAVLDIMADLLVNPTYPADEVETERKRELTDLQVQLSRAPTLAQRQFELVLFGKHPYGRQTTTTALRSITREDLVAFHHAYYKPSNAVIVVAGDVNPADITARLEKHLAGWTGQAPVRPQFAAAPERTQREIILVDKPGTVQASYRIGQTIVSATNPDWPALTVAQQILGGSSTAWLFSNLREKKGYTYGAYAQSTMRIDPGYWFMWGDVRNAVADSALDMFLALAQQLKDQPVSAADLDIAKSRLTGKFPLDIETPQQVAGQVATALLLGQGKDHVQTWRQRIAAVTAADVQNAAKKYLHPENALVVISGDASVLKPKLEKFGKVTVLDEEGRPVAAADASAKPAPVVGIDGTNIPAQTLVYTMSAQGNQVSEVTRVIAHETVKGVDIVKESRTMAGMVSGSGELKFEAKTFKPISMSMSQQVQGREMNVFLSVTNGRVAGMVPTPPNGDPTPVDAALPEGVTLSGMDEYVIWMTDWATTKELKTSNFNAQSGTVVPVTIKVTGESHQKVAAGEFDVYELEIKGAGAGQKSYVRKAAPHIVVKMESLGSPVVFELKAIK